MLGRLRGAVSTVKLLASAKTLEELYCTCDGMIVEPLRELVVIDQAIGVLSDVVMRRLGQESAGLNRQFVGRADSRLVILDFSWILQCVSGPPRCENFSAVYSLFGVTLPPQPLTPYSMVACRSCSPLLF